MKHSTINKNETFVYIKTSKISSVNDNNIQI